MLCSFCGKEKAVRITRIGVLLAPACSNCTWKLSLAVKFDGYPMAQLRRHHRRDRRKHP